MSEKIVQVLGGSIAGFIAGFGGCMVDSALGATFDALGSVIPIIGISGLVYALVSFFLGLQEAYVAGVFFSFGLVIAGVVAKDGVTIISGIISITGIVIGWLWVNRDSADY